MIQGKKRSGGISRQGLRAVSYAQFLQKEVILLGDIATGLGITKAQEMRLLSRLEGNGQIIRLKRGAYYVPSKLSPSGRLNVSEYFILSNLMKLEGANYQISGPNAFHRYGFDEQVPNRLFVYNDRFSGEKEIGGYSFAFVKTSAERFQGSIKTISPDGAKIIIASKAKSLIDAIYDWPRFNTIPRAFEWIITSIRGNPRFKRELMRMAIRSGNKATLRRIGCLLEHNGNSKRSLRFLKQTIGDSKAVIPLVPKKPKRGQIDPYWGVVINDRVTY